MNVLKRMILKGLGVQFNEGWTTMMQGSAPAWMVNKGKAYIDQGYMLNAIVYAVINYTTRLASGIPWVLYQVKEDKYLNRYKRYNPLDPIAEGMNRVKGLEEIQSHQIMDIWKRPNDLQGQYEFIEQLYGYKQLLGNTYIIGYGPESGPNSGQFHQLEILPAQTTRIQYGNPMEPVSWYYPEHDPSIHYPKEQVMHSKYWNPAPLDKGGLYGLSPIQAGSRVITRNNEGTVASVYSFQNMGANGILSSFAGGAAAGDFGPEQAQQVQDDYEDRFTGPRKKGKIIVTSAPLKWQQIGLSPVDLKILEQDKADLRHICNIYGLQSQLFNDTENKAEANMDAAVKAAYTHAVIPGMRAIRDEVNRWWISKFESPGVKLWFDMDLKAIAEIQENMMDMVSWLKDTPWLTYNERRAVMEHGPYEHPDMDVPLVPDGVTPIDLVRMGVDNVDKYLEGIE